MVSIIRENLIPTSYVYLAPSCTLAKTFHVIWKDKENVEIVLLGGALWFAFYFFTIVNLFLTFIIKDADLAQLNVFSS